MLRIALILIVLTLLCRWAVGKWPWDLLVGPPTRAQRLKDARKLLGLGRVADRDDILSAHKKVIAKVHPDRGGSSDKVHEANEARDLLLSDLPEPAKTTAEDEGGEASSPD